MSINWCIKSKELTLGERQDFGICSDDRNTIYIYGGSMSIGLTKYNDLWRINIININNNDNDIKLYCIKYNNGKIYPNPRSAVQMIYYNGKLVLFGGSLGALTLTNELWTFNIKFNSWKLEMFERNDVQPNCVGYHSMCKFKKYCVLFGGSNGWYKNDFIYCNDLYVLNLETLKWKRINSVNTPSKRCSFGMCVINGYLIINGGWNGINTLSDTYMVNINDIINDNNPIWNEIIFNSSSIKGHLILNYKSQYICFGGQKGLNDMTSNELSIVYNIEYLLSNGISNIVHGFIYDSELKYGIKIAKTTQAIINKYYGMYIDRIICNNIPERRGHGGCIININNISCIFIFGGNVVNTRGYFIFPK